MKKEKKLVNKVPVPSLAKLIRVLTQGDLPPGSHVDGFGFTACDVSLLREVAGRGGTARDAWNAVMQEGHMVSAPLANNLYWLMTKMFDCVPNTPKLVASEVMKEYRVTWRRIAEHPAGCWESVRLLTWEEFRIPLTEFCRVWDPKRKVSK